MVVGENPPDGAIIDYYLPQAASGTITLTFSDGNGRKIREFSSVAPPPDTTMKNVPDYWIAPPTVLSTAAGMHRVAWDLRYPDPPTLNYGYSGNLLDYREYTLNWHAIPGKTYQSTLVGPMVLPGNYTATLTVAGRTVSQQFTVVQDPRVSVSATALADQFRLQQRMVAGITATYDAITYIERLRSALAAQTTEAGAKELDAALAPMATSASPLGIAHRDLSRRLNDQTIGDIQPSPSVVAGVDGPCQSIDKALDGLRSILAGGVSGLPAWNPPAAPACGK
jgi:hypothetical protein